MACSFECIASIYQPRRTRCVFRAKNLWKNFWSGRHDRRTKDRAESILGICATRRWERKALLVVIPVRAAGKREPALSEANVDRSTEVFGYAIEGSGLQL